MATINTNQNTGANSTINGSGSSVMPAPLPSIGKMADVLAVAAGSTALVAAGGITTLELTNPAVIATYTLTVPATATNGQLFVVTSIGGVTALTLAGGTFTLPSPLLLAAARPILLQFNAAANVWTVFLA